MMDICDLCWINFSGVIGGMQQLGRCGTIVGCYTLIQRVLWYGWGGVLKLVWCIFQVSWHGYVPKSGGVFPFECYAAV